MRGVKRPDPSRWLTPALVVAALWAALLFWKEGLHKERQPIDFLVFYEAGERVRAGGGAYDNALDPRRAYVYPQALAYFLARTHVPLGPAGAEVLWKSASLAGVAAGIGVAAWWALRQSGRPPGPRERLWLVLLALVVGLGYSPVVFGWRLGQADLLIAALLAPVLLVRGPRGAWAAGVLVGVGGVLKLSPLFLLPGLVLCLGWRVAAGAGAVMIAYAAWLAGHGLLAHEGLLYSDRIPYFKFRNAYPASSIHGMATALLAPDRCREPFEYSAGPVTAATTAILCAAYAATGLLAWRSRAGTFCLLVVAMCFGRLVSPFLEPHHHAPAVVPIAALGSLALLRRDGVMGAWAFAAWYAGSLYLPVAEVAGGRWPALLLIASDAVLLGAAWRYRDLGGEAVLAPGGGWLDRFRVPPLRSTPPMPSAGGRPDPGSTTPPPAASPSAGS